MGRERAGARCGCTDAAAERFGPVPVDPRDIQGVRVMGRGILLWLIGIPLPVILLLYLFHVV
jgi:hypothetical protein